MRSAYLNDTYHDARTGIRRLKNRLLIERNGGGGETVVFFFFELLVWCKQHSKYHWQKVALIVYGVFSCYSSLFLCFIAMEQNNNTSRPYSSTLSTFLDHVKQYLATIPPVTRFALYTPVVVCIFDRIVFPLLSLQVNISSFISLNAVSFQGKSILFRIKEIHV